VAEPTRVGALAQGAEAASSSAKWMTVALAGVGAAIVGSLGLSDLGAVEGTDRIIAVAAGGTAAMTGVIAAVMVTVAAMLPRSTSIEDLKEVETGGRPSEQWLADWLDANRETLLRDENDSVTVLAKDYKQSLREQRVAYDEYYDDLTSPEKNRRVDAASLRVGFLNRMIHELTEYAKLEQAKRAVTRSRWVVAAAALLVAAGMGLFTWGIHAPEEQGADLRGANLRGAVLNDVELRGAKLDGMKIENADLRGTDLGEASIEETKWLNTVCPDGVDSRNAGGTCAGHLEP
jgi:hypothetical protein